MLAAKVFVDPFAEASEQLQTEREALAEKKAKEAAEEAKAIQQAKQRLAGTKGECKKQSHIVVKLSCRYCART